MKPGGEPGGYSIAQSSQVFDHSVKDLQPNGGNCATFPKLTSVIVDVNTHLYQSMLLLHYLATYQLGLTYMFVCFVYLLIS